MKALGVPAYGPIETTLPSPSTITGMALGWAVKRRCKLVIVKSKASDLQQLSAWFEAGELRVPVDRQVTWSPAGVAEGLELLAAGGVRGKIAVAGPASTSTTENA